MLHVVADKVAELVQENLANDKDDHAKGDVAQRPAVIQCVRN